jgi:hypothetical protein
MEDWQGIHGALARVEERKRGRQRPGEEFVDWILRLCAWYELAEPEMERDRR